MLLERLQLFLAAVFPRMVYLCALVQCGLGKLVKLSVTIADVLPSRRYPLLCRRSTHISVTRAVVPHCALTGG